jgi:hypothetical protein
VPLDEARNDRSSGVDAVVAWAVIALCVTLAVSPALRGTWVYDDAMLPGHPLLRGWGDVARAFVRGSDAYFRALRPDEPLATGGQTWRPLPMALFALVHGTVGASALAHHLVSLSMHLATVAALLAMVSDHRRVARWKALVVALFALHPAMVEAYAYINGRSDALAGCALALLALAIQREKRWWFVAALSMGVCSKETFVIASLFVVIALAPRAHRRWSLLAWAASAAIAVGARFAIVSTQGTIHSDAAAGALLGQWLRLVALSAESLVFVNVRSMRLLAWELSAPWTWSIALWPLAVALVMLSLRTARARWLLLGAIVTVSPAMAVANAFWLGSDRYLYQPAVLLVIAALTVDPARSDAIERRFSTVLSAAVVLLFSVFTALSAVAFESEAWFAARMRDARPEDPTGYIVGARVALLDQDPVEARRLLARTERQCVVAVQAHRMVLLAFSLGDLSLADRVIARARQTDGALSVRLRADLFDLRGRQRRWPDAMAVRDELLGAAGAQRDRTARVLRAITRTWPPDVQREATASGLR